MSRKSLSQIEKLEFHYLNKYYYFLKFAEDELLAGFRTKEDIKQDWFGLYKSEISDFSVGAERIVYSLLNRNGIDILNPCSVGAGLFFEVSDAYIHLDLKTVGATLHPKKANKKLGQKAWSNNIGDYNNHIFVGTNQNSYKGKMLVTRGKDKGKLRDYTPNLPTYYSKSNVKKICLSYFITILYDKDTLEILVMSIVCMPNGELESNYKNRVLQAGKNLDKTRFRFSEVPDFELLEGKPKRIKVVYFDTKMDVAYKNKLSFFENLYAQNE